MENQGNLYSNELQDFVELNELTFEEITKERKEQLNIISTLRKRDIIVYASDFNKGSNPISINPADFLPFKSGNDLMLSLSAFVTITPAESL